MMPLRAISFSFRAFLAACPVSLRARASGNLTEKCSRRWALCVIEFHPVAVIARNDAVHPIWMVQIPAHGFFQSRLKCFRRTPAEFVLNFWRIDRIAAIMPWAVCDKSDLICIMSARLGFDPIQSRAECLHDIEIGFLIASADVVRFARTTAREHGAQSGAMVADIEPVTDVQAIAV